MCNPAAVQIGIMVVGAAMSAKAASDQSKAAQNEANYQQAVAENNQIIAERNAKEIEKQGKREADKYRANVDRMIADETLSLVAQGGDITFGSNVDLLADYAELGERDAQVIEQNTRNEAYKARVQGSNYGAQAGLYGMRAAAEDPFMAGTSSLLSSGGTVAKTWAATG